MPLAVLLGGLLFILCVLCWVVGEIFGKVWLRVPAGLLLIPLVAVVPYTFGSMMGSIHAYIDASGSTADFMEAAASEIEDGNEARVLEEITRLSGEINETYEGGYFVDAMDAATQRVQGHEAAR